MARFVLDKCIALATREFLAIISFFFCIIYLNFMLVLRVLLVKGTIVKIVLIKVGRNES